MRTTSTLLVVVMSASLASVTGCKPKEEPNTPASVSADTAPAENPQMKMLSGSMVGSVGVSGAPGGKADHDCAVEGISKIQDDLEF